ncbi:Uncharacterised protein [Vibrio cholerae]|nr:Uncharacterised protein [Vibrio cholerae]
MPRIYTFLALGKVRWLFFKRSSSNLASQLVRFTQRAIMPTLHGCVTQAIQDGFNRLGFDTTDSNTERRS